jgi:glycosyltransferase involved in cell wall biosynthesis
VNASAIWVNEDFDNFGIKAMNLYPTSMSDVESSRQEGPSLVGSVGIIMRTQNRPVLLARALSSVLSQKYQNWHLWVINDAGSVEQLEQLVKPFRTAFRERLHVIHRQKSIGMEAASNAGLKEALAYGCEFICVHDDDDSWDSNYLQETTKWLSLNSTFAAVVTEKVIVRERIEDKQYVVEEGWDPGFVPQYITFGNLTEANQFPPICLTVRASVCRIVGDFNEALPVLGDWDYHIRILCVGDIGVIPKKLAYYHHRKAATDAYGNTVNAGVQKHEAYGAQFMNSMMRQLAKENPGYLAMLHILLRSQRDMYWRYREQGEYIERALVDLRPIVQEQTRQMKQALEELRDIKTQLREERKEQKSWLTGFMEKFK